MLPLKRFENVENIFITKSRFYQGVGGVLMTNLQRIKDNVKGGANRLVLSITPKD